MLWLKGKARRPAEIINQLAKINDEKDISTFEKKAGKQARISRSHEQQERPQDAGPSSLPRTFAPHRIG